MEQRSRFIYIRISPSEESAVKRMALQRGVTVSEAVRAFIREAAERAGLPPIGLFSANEAIPTTKRGEGT